MIMVAAVSTDGLLSVSSLCGNHDGCCCWYIFEVSKILIRESFRSPFEFNYDVWCCCLDGCCFDVPFTKECMRDSFISLRR